jgi:hypothetical protein
MSLCPFSKYSKIFGISNKGFHRFRLINTAAGDYIGTIIGAIILTYFTQIPLVLTTIYLLVLGIVLHILFGVPTAAVKYLGLNCS